MEQVAGRRIALTGGIASGKSTVGELFADRGAVVIDSDVLARQVVAPGTPGLAAVVERFGEQVLQEDGSLDRAALGRIVFADPTARADLNAMTHPLVRAGSVAAQQEAWRQGLVAIRMIPLLVETFRREDFDDVIVVDLPVELQLQRLMDRTGLSEQEARARMASQVSREERLAWATHVVDNSGPVEALAPQVDRVWAEISSRPAERTG